MKLSATLGAAGADRAAMPTTLRDCGPRRRHRSPCFRRACGARMVAVGVSEAACGSGHKTARIAEAVGLVRSRGERPVAGDGGGDCANGLRSRAGPGVDAADGGRDHGLARRHRRPAPTTRGLMYVPDPARALTATACVAQEYRKRQASCAHPHHRPEARRGNLPSQREVRDGAQWF